MSYSLTTVIPAQAGIQLSVVGMKGSRVPVFAGMTEVYVVGRDH
jgi:hypothetical protein